MIIICDINSKVTEAAKKQGFMTWQGNILDNPGILVSPANSFGYMDGGIDLVYSNYMPDIQERVQLAINRSHNGELLVGDALTVPTDIPYRKRHPYLIAAPTMRTPNTNLQGTIAPYLAMKAIVREFKRLDEFGAGFDLLCPGLGTAVGRFDPELALLQMKVATMSTPVFNTWVEAHYFENAVRVGDIDSIQNFYSNSVAMGAETESSQLSQ